VCIGALVVSSAGSTALLTQAWQFAYSVLERLLYFFERFFELLAAKWEVAYKESPKPEPFKPPRDDGKLGISLFVVMILGIACVLFLGGARYPGKATAGKPHETQQKDSTSYVRHPVESLPS
jgi:hypothetical protein